MLQYEYARAALKRGLLFHPADAWPGAVDLEKTHRWVAAFTEIAVKLLQRRN